MRKWRSPSQRRIPREISCENYLIDSTSFIWRQNLQLIPGHEVIGVIVQVGTRVKHLVEGDRCVADPIVAVGILLRLPWRPHKTVNSARTASSAEEDRHIYARTGELAVSPCLAHLLSISFCKGWSGCFTIGGGLVMNSYPETVRKYTRSIN